MSRAHVEVRVVNDQVVIVDRGSTNGVSMRGPGQQSWTRLAPWQPATWRPGASIQLGRRTLRLEAPTPQEPQRHPRVDLQQDMPQPRHARHLAAGPSPNAFTPRRFHVASDGQALSVGHAAARRSAIGPAEVMPAGGD
jgi:RND superfamily putative drug exporter